MLTHLTNMNKSILTSQEYASLMMIVEEVDDLEASFAFAGSVIFVVISKEYLLFEKLLLFFISFLIGINVSEFFSNIINIITPDKIIADRPIGALLGSALSVNIIAFLISVVKNPVEFVYKIIYLINKLRGKENEPR